MNFILEDELISSYPNFLRSHPLELKMKLLKEGKVEKKNPNILALT